MTRADPRLNTRLSVVLAAAVLTRRNFASYPWNRRTNTQQFGGQQGIFPILGLDWRC